MVNQSCQKTRELRHSTRIGVPWVRLVDEPITGLAIDDDDIVEGYEIIKEMADPIACVAKGDADTLHYGAAMRAKDAGEFKIAMQKEADAHTTHGHWEFFKKRVEPDKQSILPLEWAYKRKMCILTGEYYKRKARLNIHGGNQTYGEKF